MYENGTKSQPLYTGGLLALCQIDNRAGPSFPYSAGSHLLSIRRGPCRIFVDAASFTTVGYVRAQVAYWLPVKIDSMCDTASLTRQSPTRYLFDGDQIGCLRMQQVSQRQQSVAFNIYYAIITQH